MTVFISVQNVLLRKYPSPDKLFCTKGADAYKYVQATKYTWGKALRK